MKHNPRCAIFNEPPTLRMASDCNCGAIPPLPSPTTLHGLTTQQVTHELANWLYRAVWVRSLDSAGAREPWEFNSNPLGHLSHEDRLLWITTATQVVDELTKKIEKGKFCQHRQETLS